MTRLKEGRNAGHNATTVLCEQSPDGTSGHDGRVHGRLCKKADSNLKF